MFLRNFMLKSEIFNEFSSFVSFELEESLLKLDDDYEWKGRGARETIDDRRSVSRVLNDVSTTFLGKEQLLKKFIKEWGGISRIKDETIRGFVDIKNAENFVFRNDRIASASKALSLWNPTKCFIYDSHVGIALNEMWEKCLKTKELKSPYVLCPSRSDKSKEVINFLKEKDLVRRDWEGGGKKGFYFDWYVPLVIKVSGCYEKEYPEKVEMALFDYGGGGKSQRRGRCCKKH